MIWVGYEIGRLLRLEARWTASSSARSSSISSTTIIVKALEELGKTKETFAQLIFGILIVEDILAIVHDRAALGLRDDRLARAGRCRPHGAASSALSSASLVVGGLIAVPRLLDYVARVQEQRDAAGHRARACASASRCWR